MNVAASIGANVAINAALARKRLIGHFETAGALAPDNAVALPPKAPAFMVKSLVKQGVLIPAEEGRFYLDRTANSRALLAQGKAGVVVVLGLVAILALVVAILLIVGER